MLMRLLDGSSGLLSPPGVGKMHTLRRLSWSSGDGEDNEGRMKRLLGLVELQLSEEKLQKFRSHLFISVSNAPTGFKGDVTALLNAIKDYSGFENSKLQKWVEKNHNLEFYWGRVLMAFSNPRLLVMMRDPRDVWGSWREECRKNNLDTGKTQMRRNLQQHLFEETVEASLGVSRFKNTPDILEYYKVPEKNRTVFNKALSNVMFNGIQGADVNAEIIDVDAYAHSDNEAGRFAWNYRIIAERTMWLVNTYPDKAAIVCYENLVISPEKMVKQITEFCEIEIPLNIAPTEIGEQWSGNSSFAANFQGVSTDSVGRWKKRLDDEEVAAIMAVAGKAYEESVKWQEKALQPG